MAAGIGARAHGRDEFLQFPFPYEV
jgi:hypothetical protein